MLILFTYLHRLKMSMLLGISLLISISPTYAQETLAWSSSIGPGTQTNYGIHINEATWLYITCKDAEPVTMRASFKGQPYGSGEKDFKLIIDGSEYLSPPYQLSDFDSFWDTLRHAQILHLSTSQGLTELPTQGLVDALPASSSADYNCYTVSHHSSALTTDLDFDKFAVEAGSADMTQTQMVAELHPDISLPWYKKAWGILTSYFSRH